MNGKKARALRKLTNFEPHAHRDYNRTEHQPKDLQARIVNARLLDEVPFEFFKSYQISSPIGSPRRRYKNEKKAY